MSLSPEAQTIVSILFDSFWKAMIALHGVTDAEWKEFLSAQVACCQDIWHDLEGNHRSFNWWAVEIEKRMQRGEQSRYCKICNRSKWKDEQCHLFVEKGSTKE